MAFSYVPANLATSLKDQIRLLIGDTQQATPTGKSLDDVEINWRITESNNDLLTAAVRCAEDLLARWAFKEVGTTAHQNDQRYLWLKENARRIRERMVAECGPLVSGLSIADKTAIETDTDRVQPAFKRGMFDTPLAPQVGLPGTGGDQDQTH